MQIETNKQRAEKLNVINEIVAEIADLLVRMVEEHGEADLLAARALLKAEFGDTSEPYLRARAVSHAALKLHDGRI